MWDEFNTLRRAIRRPMRKWWKRVGVWWLAVMLLMLLIEGGGKVLSDWLYMQAVAGVQHSSAMVGFLLSVHWTISYSLGDLCLAIVYTLALLLGLLTAQAALTSANQLYANVAAPRLHLRARMLFLLACANAWPAFIVALLIGSGLWHLFLQGVSLLVLNPPATSYLRQIEYLAWPGFMTLLIMLAWMLAILMTKRSMRWPLIWCLALCLPVVYSKVPELVGNLTGSWQVSYSMGFAELVELETGLGWALGAALFVGLVRAIQTDRRRTALILFCICCLSSFLYGFGDRMPFSTPQAFNYAPAVRPSSDLSIGLNLLRASGEFTARPLATSEYGGFPEVQNRDEYYLMFASPIAATFITKSDPTWLVLLINLAYIALHYVFIWFLLGWLPKRRRNSKEHAS